MGVWTKSFTQFEGVMTFEVFESQRPDTVSLHFWMKLEDPWLLFSKVRFFLRYLCWKLEVWGNIYWHSRFSSLRDRILCLFISGWNRKTLGCYFQKFVSFSDIFAENWKFEGISIDIRVSETGYFVSSFLDEIRRPLAVIFKSLALSQIYLLKVGSLKEYLLTFEVFESQRQDTLSLNFRMKSEDPWLLFSKVRFFLRYLCWKLEANLPNSIKRKHYANKTVPTNEIESQILFGSKLWNHVVTWSSRRQSSKFLTKTWMLFSSH
jgi:hypothetical protein